MTESKILLRAPGVQVPPGRETPSLEPWPLSTAHCVWAHALHLFHNYLWESSLRYFRRLFYHCHSLTDERSINLFKDVRMKFLYNIGILEAMLGEKYLASQEFFQCVQLDERFVLARYALGLATFGLGDFRRAERVFRYCMEVMDTAKAETVEHAISPGEGNVMGLGSTWKLARTSMDSNARKSFEEKLYKASRVKKPMDGKWALNGIPVGVLLEPPADMLKINVNFELPLIWVDDGLKKYLKQYSLVVKEQQGPRRSTKRERTSSVATDKRLPPLPPATPGAKPIFAGDVGSVVRRQMIEGVRLATRRREKTAPERAIPSPIVPPKGIVISKTITSAPSTSNSVRNSQETIRGPRHSFSTIRQPSFVLPKRSPRIESSTSFTHEPPLLPYKPPHRGEIASQALARRSLNHSSTQSPHGNSFTYSSASSALQLHPDIKSTTDFAYDSQRGLRIAGLGSVGRRDFQAYSPAQNSSVFNLYLEREWAVDDAETVNDFENDEDTNRETENEDQDYAEIVLLPRTYQPPQFTDQDASEAFPETPNKRISMFLDTREDPAPSSPVHSPHPKPRPSFPNPSTYLRPSPSLYSTETAQGSSTTPCAFSSTYSYETASIPPSSPPRPFSNYASGPAPSPPPRPFTSNYPPHPRPHRASTISHPALTPSSVYSSQNSATAVELESVSRRRASSVYSTDTVRPAKGAGGALLPRRFKGSGGQGWVRDGGGGRDGGRDGEGACGRMSED